jgi:hypothetical protein
MSTVSVLLVPDKVTSDCVPCLGNRRDLFRELRIPGRLLRGILEWHRSWVWSKELAVWVDQSRESVREPVERHAV